MGYLHKAVCYPDVPTARLHWVGDLPAQWGSGPSVIRSEVVNPDPTSATYALCTRVDGGPCTLTEYSYPDFPECDFAGGVDLNVSMFGIVLGMLVVVWAASHLYRIFWRPYDPI